MKLTNENIETLEWLEWDDGSTAIVLFVERDGCPTHDPNVHYLSKDGMQVESLSSLNCNCIGHQG